MRSFHKMMKIIVDAHQDLAWNMLSFGRNYTRASTETRKIEQDGPIPAQNGESLLGWPDYQRGNVAIIFSTLFASPRRRQMGAWETESYASMEEAHQRYSAQLEAYHRLTEENPTFFRILQTQADLKNHLAEWRSPLPPEASGRPVGLVILMEGGEGVREPGELAEWWQRGLRILGPAWAGTRFCGGTREPGPLTRAGEALLDEMAAIGFTLDVSHMDPLAALQALERYPGPIIASHANPLALLSGSESNRHLTEPLLERLLERGAVIGTVFYNAFLRAGWKPGDSRALVPLERVAEHMDYICQKAGNARQAAIGSDFDGGLGLAHVPEGIDSIADLQKLPALLEKRGYTENDIENMLGGNWISHLERSLPA